MKIFATMILCLLLVGCNVPSTAGEAVTQAPVVSTSLNQAADQFDATGKSDKAEKYRTLADQVDSIGDKINAAIADGVIDENDAIEQVLPHLNLTIEERDAARAMLEITGGLVRGEATTDDAIGAAQTALPIFLPGYGVLIAAGLGILRSVITKKNRSIDSIVAGVQHHIDNGGGESWQKAEQDIRLKMGNKAADEVAKSKARAKMRALKADLKARNKGIV